MTNLNKQRVIDKLQLLEEYVSYLKTLAKETENDKAKFLRDFHFFGTAERYLQISIQTLIDTIQIIIIDEGLEKPDESQEAISLLYAKKIISANLAEKLNGIVGFRNILVHEYGKVDKEKIYQYLQERIENLEQFKKEILDYCR